jgi:hypothetical protein
MTEMGKKSGTKHKTNPNLVFCLVSHDSMGNPLSTSRARAEDPLYPGPLALIGQAVDPHDVDGSMPVFLFWHAPLDDRHNLLCQAMIQRHDSSWTPPPGKTTPSSDAVVEVDKCMWSVTTRRVLVFAALPVVVPALRDPNPTLAVPDACVECARARLLRPWINHVDME